MRNAKILIGILCLLLAWPSCAVAQDPGWPRRIIKSGGKLVMYQPQVDDWHGFTDIKWRQAFQLTPSGGKQVVGAVSFHGATSVDTDTHMVLIDNLSVVNTYFPSLDPATTAQMDQLVRTFIPPYINISLDRVVAYLPKPQTANTVELNNSPPLIFVSYTPAILLGIDGEPVLTDLSQTDLKSVVNTTWPLFFDKSNSQYYLLIDNIWLTAVDLNGPWSRSMNVPRDFKKLPDAGKFAEVKKAYPPAQVSNPIIPKVFYATSPAEVILFEGQPSFMQIPGTRLVYATNTDSPVLVDSTTQTYYYLAAGRWFSASSLEGPWTFASLTLPSDFANIPLTSPASAILASVPGTNEAKDAVLIAQIPTTMILNPTAAAAQAHVSYFGAPQFAPITGTSLQYATNTVDKVIQVGDVYYLCLQGVWFMSTSPQGPWTTASSVPQVIYTIPPSSPVYNVTYVTQVTTSSGDVQASYTAGYLGAFVMGAAVGAIIANGTGYYYPPYIGYPVGGYPYYHPYPTPYGYGGYGSTPYYNSRTGAYGYSNTSYGAYGKTTTAAQYNPYTGTYARGASTSTAYGRQSVGQAYNPYTGTYSATHQGSSPTARWGQSYVQQGNKSAYSQHYSTANGSVGSIQGSQGGHGYATSSVFGNTYAGKNSSGDMYAGHDGSVYQNNGSSWQKYDNGSWKNVNVNTQQAQQKTQNYEQQHPNSQADMQQHAQSFNQDRSSGSFDSQSMNSDMQSRMSGASQSDRFQQGHSNGGGGWGGGHSWGGFGGGGRSWGGGDRSWGGGGWRR
jgi:uncharacterized membrane protein YgcG